MIPAERRSEILKLINEQGRISVADIALHFDVSEMTARRDLRTLDREGLLRRVHGGAVSRLGRSYEPPYHVRTTESQQEKTAIGKAAADLIVDGDSVALDVGTTTLEIARALSDHHNLTIVTSSLPIANEIVSSQSLDKDIRMILTGGIVRARELSMIGHLPKRVYAEMHVDKAFLGVGGLSAESGLTEYNLEDARVKKPMISTAKKVIVVADGSKIGRTTFSLIGPISCMDTLVTDSSAPTEELEKIREQGAEIIVVEV